MVLTFPIPGYKSKSSLLCYSEVAGPKRQICDTSFGFQTCFTKYNHSEHFLDYFYIVLMIFSSDHEIILRGCSSKRKMFHIECESHLSGTRSEQFCYCGYDLCNKAVSDLNGGLSEKMYLVICLAVLINKYYVLL